MGSGLHACRLPLEAAEVEIAAPFDDFTACTAQRSWACTATSGWKRAIRNVADGSTRTVPTCAVFITVGAAPNTQWLSGLARVYEKGLKDRSSCRTRWST